MSKLINRGDAIEPVYLNNMAVALRGWGITSGLAVGDASGPDDMSVDVAAGFAFINDTSVVKASITNVAITAAHATYDRYDLVVIDFSGMISVVDGTTGVTTYANDYDLETHNSILLAEVYVQAAVTEINAADVTDKRLYHNDPTPIGVPVPYTGTTAPAGYLLCDGSAVSRTTYSALFAVCSTAYGVGNGTTTFNVPDMQGRVPVGIGASGVTNLGDTGGEQTHTLTVAELAAHHHTDTLDLYALENATGRAYGTSGCAYGSAVITSDDTGDGDAHQNMQPYVGFNYIIKT